ncbi:hypothetical protein F383_27594 [Gossypium arboreum]|uniref:Uncharacterized protein n=1 Tax=Gossypium arboreum TaxID=29729 RepID=A0A0B0P7Z0_GOSAR|nr:hypothetical protein F383_27594 [Gossypium arboreum]
MCCRKRFSLDEQSIYLKYRKDLAQTSVP